MTSTTLDVRTLPLRLMLGMGFIHHGFHKAVFTEQHWQFVTLLQGIGVPEPNLVVWIVSAFEFAAGIAIILGVWPRAVASVLIVHMVVALTVVHLRQGFDFMQFDGVGTGGPRFRVPGYEVNLLYIAGLLTLIAMRTGRSSLGSWRPARRGADASPP